MRILFLALFGLLFTGLVFADEKKDKKKPDEKKAEEKKPEEKKDNKPDVADYEKVLKYFETWGDNLTNPDFWMKVELKNKKTGEVRKFPDLSDYEKHVFYLMSAEKLSNEMKRLHDVWKGELKNVKKGDKLTKKQIEGFCNKLLEQRKKHALRFEALAKKIFDTFKDKFSDEERNKLMKEIEEFHDQEKLIERKK